MLQAADAFVAFLKTPFPAAVRAITKAYNGEGTVGCGAVQLTAEVLEQRRLQDKARNPDPKIRIQHFTRLHSSWASVSGSLSCSLNSC